MFNHIFLINYLVCSEFTWDRTSVKSYFTTLLNSNGYLFMCFWQIIKNILHKILQQQKCFFYYYFVINLTENFADMLWSKIRQKVICVSVFYFLTTFQSSTKCYNCPFPLNFFRFLTVDWLADLYFVTLVEQYTISYLAFTYLLLYSSNYYLILGFIAITVHWH